MRYKTILLSSAFLMLLFTMGISQSLVRESFDYPATIDGLGSATDGWGGPWAIDTSAHGTEDCATMAGYVFNYDDLNWTIPDTGNAVQVTKKYAWSQAQRYKRPLAETWPNTAGKTYWFSYLLDVKEPLPVANTYFMLKLYNNSNELLAVGKAGGGPDTPVYTCGSGWTGAGDDVSSVVIEGGPVWLVVRIDMSGGSGADRTFMWVDPDPASEPDTSSADVKRNSSMPNGFNMVALEFGGDGTDVQVIFDEISLASAYSDLSAPVTALEPVKRIIPNEFTLSQNYPNPFNPATQIEFSVLNKGKVTLTVFDLLGRQVAVLVNDILTPGTYKTQFSAENLPSGIYFYRLSTPTGAISKKMTVLK